MCRDALDASEEKPPVKVIVIHADVAVLENASNELSRLRVPHAAVLGSISHPKQLLKSLYCAGLSGDLQVRTVSM